MCGSILQPLQPPSLDLDTITPGHGYTQVNTCMESKESRVKRGASWEVPQQSGPIAAELWDVSGSLEPSLTISFIEKKVLSLILKVERVSAS